MKELPEYLDEKDVHKIAHRINKELESDWENDEKVFERFMALYPEDVYISYIDDKSFCSSFIGYVVHRCKKSYMGVTVYVYGQCTNDFYSFFMYPQHSDSMKDVLESVYKLYENTDPFGNY